MTSREIDPVKGIYVGPAQMFRDMTAAVAEHQLNPVLDRVFDFADAPAALSRNGCGRPFWQDRHSGAMTCLLNDHVIVGGHRIACGTHGIGDPLVLVHGTPSHSFIWRNVVPKLNGAGTVANIRPSVHATRPGQ